MSKKIRKTLYWSPRILGILFVLFISIFALDVFDEGFSFWNTLLALLMHLIPSFVLTLTLWLSWKKEGIGGTVFIILGITYIALTFSRGTPFFAYIIIAGPAFLIGFLFLLNKFFFKETGREGGA